jgi:hypothetical protein
MTAPIDIGSRLELFVDRYLIQMLDRAALELHRPVEGKRTQVYNTLLFESFFDDIHA